MEERHMTAAIGHNNPPDPIDTALAPFGDYISEAEGWLDGEPVSDEGQMKAVDALIKEIRAAEKAVNDAKESEAKPLHDAWKAALARYKPTLDDLDRIKKGLVATVDAFKRKLAAEKAEAERKARAEAEAKMRAAAEAARAADAANIEAQREAARLQQEAEDAQRAVAKASKDTVKGLVTVTRYEITDHRALLHWIAKNDKDAMTAFIEEYARSNHRRIDGADGLRVWQEKIAR
jgi:hypothetical protein